jgi:hypothetical protein
VLKTLDDLEASEVKETAENEEGEEGEAGEDGDAEEKENEEILSEEEVRIWKLQYHDFSKCSIVKIEQELKFANIQFSFNNIVG